MWFFIKDFLKDCFYGVQLAIILIAIVAAVLFFISIFASLIVEPLS